MLEKQKKVFVLTICDHQLISMSMSQVFLTETVYKNHKRGGGTITLRW